MLILGYCPKCGYVFSGDEEVDVNNFNDSRFDRFLSGKELRRMARVKVTTKIRVTTKTQVKVRVRQH